MFNNDNEVTHAIGMLPDDFDSTVVHKRVNGEWVLEGTYSQCQGRQRAGALAQDRSRTRSSTADNLRRTDRSATTGSTSKTGAKELIYRDPEVDVDEVVFNDDDEAIAVKSQYDYPTYVPLKPEDPLVVRRQRLVAALPGPPDHDRVVDGGRPRARAAAFTATGTRGSSISGTSTTARSGSCSIPGRR